MLQCSLKRDIYSSRYFTQNGFYIIYEANRNSENVSTGLKFYLKEQFTLDEDQRSLTRHGTGLVSLTCFLVHFATKVNIKRLPSKEQSGQKKIYNLNNASRARLHKKPHFVFFFHIHRVL